MKFLEIVFKYQLKFSENWIAHYKMITKTDFNIMSVALFLTLALAIALAVKSRITDERINTRYFIS